MQQASRFAGNESARQVGPVLTAGEQTVGVVSDQRDLAQAVIALRPENSLSGPPGKCDLFLEWAAGVHAPMVKVAVKIRTDLKQGWILELQKVGEDDARVGMITLTKSPQASMAISFIRPAAAKRPHRLHEWDLKRATLPYRYISV